MNGNTRQRHFRNWHFERYIKGVSVSDRIRNTVKINKGILIFITVLNHGILIHATRIIINIIPSFILPDMSKNMLAI